MLGVFEPCTDDLGKSGEEVGTGSRKLITTDESTDPAKPLFDPIVVENFEGNGRLPNSTCADKSDGFEVFSEFDDLFDQLVPSETVPRRRGRQFTKWDAMKT